MHESLNVRRFTGLDMFGTAGTARRRRIVLTEFVVGCPLLVLLAAVTLLAGHVPVGIWFLGVAQNYLPLAVYAVALFPPGALEAELAGVDVRRQLMHAGLAQLLLLLVVPFLVALVAAVQKTSARSHQYSRPDRPQ